jgi:hypothetical protein
MGASSCAALFAQAESRVFVFESQPDDAHTNDFRQEKEDALPEQCRRLTRSRKLLTAGRGTVEKEHCCGAALAVV